MDDDIDFKFAEICRTCGKDDTVALTYLFAEALNNAIEKLEICANITIDMDDDLPKYICDQCLIWLENAFDFRSLCKRTERSMRNTLVYRAVRSRIQITVRNKRSSVGLEDYRLTKSEEEKSEIESSSDSMDNYSIEQVIDITSDEEKEPSDSSQTISPILNAAAVNENVETIVKTDPPTSDSIPVRTIEGNYHGLHSKNALDRSKTYKCDDCTFSTGAQQSFLDHKTIHTSEKNYTCVECGKKFRFRSNLSRHVSVHLADVNLRKMHQCKLCPLKYTLSENLKHHVDAIHNPDTPHKCGVCKKRFGAPSMLKQHLERVHLRDGQYECKFDGKKFLKSDQYLEHINSKHDAQMVENDP